MCMDFKKAISEKGGGLDEERMEDILDCVRRSDSNRFFILCNRMGHGDNDRYDI